MSEQVTHPFPAVCDSNSRILILGSFPSVKSREINFYYGHPQNRFWKLLEEIFQEKIGTDVTDKKQFLKKKGIALWDVIASCRITGSADSSITDVRCNDIKQLLETTGIKRIYVNGRTAEKLYDKYVLPLTGVNCIYLPSTSPANAATSFNRLLENWRIIGQ